MTLRGFLIFPLIFLPAFPMGAQEKQAEPTAGPTVSIASSLEIEVLDFLVSELNRLGFSAVFHHYRDEALLLAALRSGSPSEHPELLFGTSTILLAHITEMFEPRSPDFSDDLPIGLTDRDHRWTGVFGDPVTILYNHQYYEEDGLLSYLPRNFEDLALPRYRGSLVLEQPTRFNMTGYLYACIIDRAEQLEKNRDAGFDLLAGIDRNVLRYYSSRETILTLEGLFSGGDGTITADTLGAMERCAQKGQPVNFTLPREGLFLFPRGIALMKGASKKAKAIYDVLTSSEFLEGFSRETACFLLGKEADYSLSVWPGQRITLEFFPTDHDSVRRNIDLWLSEWQNLHQGKRKSKTETIDNALNTTLTFLIPAVLLILIWTSRVRGRGRGPKKNSA